MQGVRGSSPLSSTEKGQVRGMINDLARDLAFFFDRRLVVRNRVILRVILRFMLDVRVPVPGRQVVDAVPVGGRQSFR